MFGEIMKSIMEYGLVKGETGNILGVVIQPGTLLKLKGIKR